MKKLLMKLFIISLPFYGFSFFLLVGYPIGRPDWLIGSLLVAFSILLLVNRAKLVVDASLLWFIGLILWSLVGLFKVDNVGFFVTLFLQLLFALIIFVMVLQVRSLEELDGMVKVWLTTSSVVALYGIYQTLARNLGWPLSYLPLTNPTISAGGMRGGTFGQYIRPSSVFREPAFLASYLLPVAIFLIVLYAEKKIRRKGTIQLLVISIGLVLAFSLVGYIAVTLTFTLYMLLEHGLGKHGRLAALFLGVGLIVVFIQPAFLTGFERLGDLWRATELGFESIAYRSTGVRLLRMFTAFSIWVRNPIVGIGLGQIPHVNVSEVLQLPFSYSYSLNRVHSIALQFLAEAGVVGFVAYLGIFFTILRKLFKEKRESPIVKAFFYALLSSFIMSFYRSGIVDLNYWVLAAMSAAYVNSLRHTRKLSDYTGATSRQKHQFGRQWFSTSA